MVQKALMDPYRAFYETVGANYPEDQIVYKTLSGRLRKAFILNIIKNWKGRMLDIGCGGGVYLKEYTGGEKVGMDISWHALAKLRRQDPKINLVVADAQKLGCFQEEAFDFILCSEVLEHVPCPESVLKGIFALLKPGGQILITTPNYHRVRPFWTEIGVLKKFGIQGIKENFYIHTAFRPEELAHIGKQIGFSCISKGTFEKEVRYARKCPAVLFLMLQFFNRITFRSVQWEWWNQKMYEYLTLLFYGILKALGMVPMLNQWVKEGVRTYVIFQKPSSTK